LCTACRRLVLGGFITAQNGAMPLNVQALTALLGTPGLTDLLINGPTDAFADFGAGLRRVEHPCPDAGQLAEIARWMIALADRHLDFANPFADCVVSSAQLGVAQHASFRMHAVLGSASSRDTLLSIRRHNLERVTLDSFIGGRLELAAWLHELVAEKSNFLISGATGSGKTSLLGALVSSARDERVIAVEDVSELSASNGHFVSLQTRQANTEGRGEVGLEKLVREALRMRPDRLLVGEIRGSEMLTFINALNTGHKGAGGTIHANSASAVATRIETIGLQAGWNPAAVAASAAEAIDVVIHLEKKSGRRLISQVSRLSLNRRGHLTTVPVDSLQGFL
jgi:pilus assembly protein CpaF